MSTAMSALTVIYTLTPTHCGTGQAVGAVDLPIAREKHTDLPVLPATTLKGVARDAFERNAKDEGEKKKVGGLFGPKIEPGGTGEEHHAGRLVFCEGKLLAFPARSLNRPFFFVTARLLVERLSRDLRAFGFEALAAKARLPASAGALVAESAIAGKPLVVEDLVYDGAEVRAAPEVSTLGDLFSGFLPEKEKETQQRLRTSLLVLPDDDFLSLVQRAVPVQARIALTGGKTTDRWSNPETGKDETGNLWYEEALPADCLFAAFVTERFQHRASNDKTGAKPGVEWKDFWDRRGQLASVQIGGNETVGYGRTWWNAVAEGGAK